MEFLGLAAYFVPSIVAGLRHHRERTGIFLVNLLLGWTVVFWIVALVWSLGGSPRLIIRTVERRNRGTKEGTA